jgi:hypothetical protein
MVSAFHLLPEIVNNFPLVSSRAEIDGFTRFNGNGKILSLYINVAWTTHSGLAILTFR